MKRMTLIGTSHIDLEGMARLSLALEALAPDIITIEMPHDVAIEEAVRERGKMIASIREATRSFPAENKMIAECLLTQMLFEADAAHAYAKSAGIAAISVDTSRPIFFKQDYTGGVEPLRTGDFKGANMTGIIGKMNRVQDAAYRGTAAMEHAAKKHPWFKGLLKALEEFYANNDMTKYVTSTLAERDDETAQRMRSAHADGHLVHIGGMAHVFPELYGIGRKTIRQHFPDAERLRLCDIYQFR